jgi:hypothetical protein
MLLLYLPTSVNWVRNLLLAFRFLQTKSDAADTKSMIWVLLYLEIVSDIQITNLKRYFHISTDKISPTLTTFVSLRERHMYVRRRHVLISPRFFNLGTRQPRSEWTSCFDCFTPVEGTWAPNRQETGSSSAPAWTIFNSIIFENLKWNTFMVILVFFLKLLHFFKDFIKF